MRRPVVHALVVHVLVVLVTVGVLGACGDGSGSTASGDDGSGGTGSGDGGSGGGSGDTGGVDLQGTYVTDSVDSGEQQLVPGTTVRLTFDGDHVTMQAGCNTMSGSFRVDSGRLAVHHTAVTMMGCDEARMKQDDWLTELLRSSPSVSLSDGVLTLTSQGTTLRLAGEHTQDAPLQGTSWRLDTVLSGAGADGTASSVPSGARHPGIRFTSGVVGWDVAFSTGCNQGSGPVRVGAEVMDFGALATTKVACADDLADLEQTFLGVLGRGTTYSIVGDRLTLTAADGKSGLVFVAG